MKDHLAADNQVHSANEAGAVPALSWRIPAVWAIAGVLALLGIYHGTFRSMVDIWWRSDTFTHGFLIFPLSAWLIWRRRHVLAALEPKPDYRALPVLVLAGLGWLVANGAGALVVEQLALIVMIPPLVWLLLGWQVFLSLLFPLAFLVFSVPMGEVLIPPLMNFTADFTVGMLKLTGIPVYRDGTFFSIPSGDWSVVEACSGLRYLIASITLGFLYAYLTFVSQWRRLAFMVLSTFFPILANGFRAYMIVMIGHLSSMRLAVGVDHLIYGWLFFGLVMLLMFWLGSFWAEEQPPPPPIPPATQATSPRAMSVRFAPGFAVALIVAGFWPARASYVEHSLEQAASVPVSLALPEGAGGWQRVDQAATEWEPFYSGQDAKSRATYQDGDSAVELYVLYYHHQRQDAELINSQNMLAPQVHPVWKMPEEKPREAKLDGAPATVRQGRLLSARQDLLVWRWNRIAGRYTANDYVGKLLSAKERLLGEPDGGTAILIATEYNGTPKAAAVLQRFVDAMLPAIERSLNSVEGGR
jgi:exosortase A